MPEENSAVPEGTETDTVDPAEALAAAQAEVGKWKALSRKNEDKAKATAKDLKAFEDWKASQLSDSERAIEEAKAAARAEVVAEYSGKLARTAFLGAAAGRLENAYAVLSRLDVAQFLCDDGEVDQNAIAEFLDSIAPAAKAPETPAAPQPNGLFQGTRSEAGGDHLALNGDPILNKVNSILGISPR